MGASSANPITFTDPELSIEAPQAQGAPSRAFFDFGSANLSQYFIDLRGQGVALPNLSKLIDHLKSTHEAVVQPERLKQGVWFDDELMHGFADALALNYPGIYHRRLASDAFFNKRPKRANEREATKHLFVKNVGHHWATLMIERRANQVHIYCADGLNWQGYRKDMFDWCERYVRWLDPNPDLVIQQHALKIPHQGNEVDCGPAACWMMYLFASGRLNEAQCETLSKQEKMDYSAFRQSVAITLGSQGQALPPYISESTASKPRPKRR